MDEAECKKTHPGFTVTCDKCGSTSVYVDISLGFSAESGQWGSIDLACTNCGRIVDIYGGSDDHSVYDPPRK